MAIRTYLQGLGATHLFDLDNNGTLTTDDLGSSSTPTNISGGTYTFDTDPVCEGVTYSLDVVANTSPGTDGAIFTNVSGINTGVDGWSSDKRSLLIWCKQADIQNPTCIYEQGGGVNNFALMGGALATFQAADSGQPFLIVQSKSLTQSDRPYCLVGVWEYHTQHAGSGNRILFYINGILQGISELTGTDSFPNHGGDIQCGNSGDSLQSFAGTTFTSQTTDKNCNFLGMFNNVSLTQAQCREIFERTAFADVLIPADTVANQQIALDALIGNTYENTNCAIRIIQATDQTNYRLFIDNITFNADSNLEDISIQFVGTGTLTVEDTNGTVIQYTSTPPEVETTSTTYTGGGSIVVVNNTIRRTSDDTITDSTATKLVFDGSGTTYTVSGGTILEFENVSGSAVTVNLSNNAPVPTLTETSGTITLIQNVAVSAANIIDASRVQIYNVTKGAELDNSVVSGGSGYSFTANLASAGVDDGDTLRLRAEYQSGTDARDSLEATGIITASGLSFLNTQENDTIYNAFGIDGSTVTGYTADYIDDEVDISVATTFSIKELYAWWVFNKSTSQGISDFAGGVTAETASIIRVNTAVVNIFLDNSTTNWIIQSDDVRWYRDDEAYPIKRPTTGGGCIDVEWRRDVALAQSAEVTAIKATVDANLDATVSSRSTQTSVDNLNNLSALDVATELATYDAPTKAEMDAGFSALNNFDPASDTVTVGSTSEDSIVDKVWDEVIDNANHNTAKSAGKRIRQAGASLSAEGTVDDPSPTVSSFITDLTQTNTSFYADQTMIFLSGDLEGQARLITSYNGTTKVVTFDEPWTVAPANTDEFEIKADHVHPVTEIQTGLATAASIAALNNLSEAQVNAQADLALTDYDAPTKAELDAAKSSIEALIVALNNLSEAQVNAQVDTALNDYDAPTKAELDLVEAKVDIALAQATLARKHLTNRDKIDTATNKLIRYDDDGTSPMLQFNLKDKNGDPASDNIYEKTPI